MIDKIGIFKDFNDNTLKSVFRINNKNIVEMSLLFNKKDKDVICVPTHYYCNLGCKMCHLTNDRINKPMISIEYNIFIDCLIQSLTDKGKRITNKDILYISFMGVGEPLLNIFLIKEVIKNEDYIKEKLGYKNIGYAISTMMPNRNLIELQEFVLSNKVPLKIHFSLHNSFDHKRIELIPNTKVSINEALSLLCNYKNMFQNNLELVNKYKLFHDNSVPVEIHYTLIDKTNDSDCNLDKLIFLLKKYNIPIKFITFNPKDNLNGSNKLYKWIETIKESIPDFKVKIYTPPGGEIGSSCGQFTKHYYLEEIESNNDKNNFIMWENSHKVS